MLDKSSETEDDSQGQDEPKSVRNKVLTSSKDEGDTVPNRPVNVPADYSGRTGNVTNSNKQNNKLDNKRAELAEIIQAWPHLPPDIRSAITAIVRASITKQEG